MAFDYPRMLRDLLVRLGLLDDESEPRDALWLAVALVAVWGATRLVRRRVRAGDR